MKKTPNEALVFNGSNYFKSQNMGYWRKSTGNRNLLHRDVWEFFNGPIPEKFDVHHLDENKDNNLLGNLECLAKSEHTRIYGIFNNQFTKGKKHREQNEAKKCPVCKLEFKKKAPGETKKAITCSHTCSATWRSKPRAKREK